MWAHRDWVVEALNADMPFDRFTIEQVAGDLLPDADERTRIATGFHRCTPTNVAAGTDPEESRMNQVFDRVNTSGAVWLGTTLECAQCHDHTYDPFPQADYYRLAAYFHSTEAEADRSNPKVPGSIRFQGPSMPLADDPWAEQRAALQAELAAARGDRQRAAPEPTAAGPAATGPGTEGDPRPRADPPDPPAERGPDTDDVRSAAVRRRIKRIEAEPAERPGADDRARVIHAVRLALARRPEQRELDVLLALLAAERAAVAARPERVAGRLAAAPGLVVAEDVAPEELAAWAAVTAALLNLDETITKG